MTSLPPRHSFTSTSPHMGTPDNTNKNSTNNLALVPISIAKDSTPASTGYPNGRSPLSSLGINNTGVGLGMRQRRQYDSSPFFNSETMKGPPRKSLSMSMGGSGGMVASMPTSVKNDMTSLLPEDSNYRKEQFWIIVFGFSNEDQCAEVVRKYRAEGNVSSVKMSSGNWVAINFDNLLSMEKAASEQRFQLNDGCFCGVQKLHDSEQFFQQQQQRSSVRSMDPYGNNSMQESINLFPPAGSTGKSVKTGAEIKEKDILMVNVDQGHTRGNSCCKSFMAWVYGW